MSVLTRSWLVLVLRGGLAWLFGLVIVLSPRLPLEFLVVTFGTYAILDGMGAIVSGLRASPRPRDRWPVTTEGLVSVVFGLLAWMWPFVPRNILHVLAGWGLLTGALEILGAALLPRTPAGRGLLALGGISSTFLAGLLFAVPHGDRRHVTWIIAGYALVFGAILLVTGLRLRPGAQASRAAPARRA